MKTKFEDISHLYLGCQCVDYTMYDPQSGTRLFNIDRLNRSIMHPDRFKLVFRKLSDMTEEEALEIVEIQCGDQYVDIHNVKIEVLLNYVII